MVIREAVQDAIRDSLRVLINRNKWHFNDRDEIREYLTALVANFEERWLMRAAILPHIPLEIALDSSQQQEVEKKKADLRRVSFILQVSQT